MEAISLGAGLAALGFWLFIAVAVIGGIWDGARKREAKHESLRRIIESGQQVDPAVMDRLFGEDKSKGVDLQVSGVITLSASVGIALLGWFISLLNAKALLPLLGAAALVAMVGIGLLIGDHGGSWETLVYVGISTLTLALTAIILRPRRFAFWGVLLVVLMAYAMGDQFVLWPLLNRVLPFLRWWRVPPRIWLIATLILPYLAGWGAQLLIERPPDRKIAR